MVRPRISGADSNSNMVLCMVLNPACLSPPNSSRETLVRQVFLRITIAGKEFVDIEPKPEYAPLFATMVTAQKVGYQELESSRSPDSLLLLPSGISVSGI